jgi:hypothetical protein
VAINALRDCGVTGWRGGVALIQWYPLDLAIRQLVRVYVPAVGHRLIVIGVSHGIGKATVTIQATLYGNVMILRWRVRLDDRLQALAGQFPYLDDIQYRLDPFAMLVNGKDINTTLREVQLLVLAARKCDAFSRGRFRGLG